MHPSSRYIVLLQALAKLRAALLPDVFEPTGTYPDAEKVHLRTVSFRILVHAEIESFIEDRAFELFDCGWSAWDAHAVSSRVLVGLLAFSGHTMSPPPSRIGSPARKVYESVNEPLTRAKKKWKDETHKDNHGVKEANVLALLLPLGFEGSKLDPTLLADLTSFGGARGAVAHKSTMSVSAYADPKSEYGRAQQLATALRTIDEQISKYLKEISDSLPPAPSTPPSGTPE